MKIFISSLIFGMQAERQAVRQAILDLGHQPVMAEDFRAQAALLADCMSRRRAPIPPPWF